MKNNSPAPVCPYCGKNAVLIKGAILYPHLPKLADINLYRCDPCDAHVGCHGDTTKPLGRLANAELRKYKMMAHKAFDPIWREHGFTRKEAYKTLAERLHIKAEDCHIGMFDIDTCKRAIVESKALKLLIHSCTS
jgi:hypothetical protein